MSDMGIIFSAPMVGALLDGRKTQTRRLLNSARVFATLESPAFTLKGDHLIRALQGADRWRHLGGTGWFWEADAFDYQAPAERTGWMANIAYATGDRLYVREALHLDHGAQVPFTYVAGGARVAWSNRAQAVWLNEYSREHCPSIHMPRWASRLWLAVADVRVQRLQDCSEADAMAEGVSTHDKPGYFHVPNCAGTGSAHPILSYQLLWDSLHTAEGTTWDANPWVVAVTFTVHQGNIDASQAA